MRKADVTEQLPINTIGARELIAWALVIAFVFAVAGTVTGWFVRSNAMSVPVSVQAPVTDNGTASKQ